MKLIYGDAVLNLLAGSTLNETVQTKSIFFQINGEFPDIQPPKTNETKILKFVDDTGNTIFERKVNRLDCQKTWHPAKSINGTFYYIEEETV